MPVVGAIVGRGRELEALARFVDAVPSGAGVALLRGEAGIGKTTLWRAAVERARDRGLMILEAGPTAAEAPLAFAALGDLLAGVDERLLDGLPEPQRDALGGALLTRAVDGAASEPRAVAIAVLGLLRALAQERPLLLAVDDLQWLDSATATVLAFAARRLRDARIGLLLAQRAEPGEPLPLQLDRRSEGVTFECHEVGPLSLEAMQRLVRETFQMTLTRPALRRVHDVCGGNPFFCIELVRRVRERGGSLAAGAALPVPAEVRQLVRARLDELPAATREALLYASVMASPTLDRIAAATGRDADAALAPAVAAGVVELNGERVRFMHPLFAAGVVDLASPARQREAHRRLAEIERDVERGARHLALATDGKDAQVAGTVADAAALVASRGAPEVAAELGEHAIRLTPADDHAGLSERAGAAALYHLTAGDSDRARGALDEIVAMLPSSAARGRAQLRRARLELIAGDRRSALHLFNEAIGATGDDPVLQADLHLSLAWTMLMLRTVPLARVIEQSHRAAELCERLDDPVMLADAFCVVAQAEFLAGGGLPSAAMEQAMALAPQSTEISGLRHPAFHMSLLLQCADRFEEAREQLQTARARSVAFGSVIGTSWQLMRLSHVECYAGNWQSAVTYLDEARELADQADERPILADVICTQALISALRGDVERARELADDGRQRAELTGSGIGGRLVPWATASLAVSTGDAAAAVRELWPLWDASIRTGIVEPGENRYVGDLVEALVSVGRHADAAAILDLYEGHARQVDRTSALVIALRCRGQLAESAGDRVRAISQLEAAAGAGEADLPLPFERARNLLALGAARRRAKEKARAREALDEARGIFDQLGAKLWAQRTEAELNRIGGRAPSRGDLTPTENRVAALVAEGHTNREVATALFVTERTVEYHLSHVYAKLGVRSRVELAQRLASRP